MKKTLIIATLAAFLSVFSGNILHAQDETAQGSVDYPVVDYKGQAAFDSDSDGLTDEGESQLYRTDPNKADSDSDGFEDGVEVLAGTNPLEDGSYPGMIVPPPMADVQQKEVPWGWYTARAAGLVGFLLLWVSIFFGLALRIPLLRRFISPAYSMSVHCWISLYALVFAFIHGIALLFDKSYEFSWAAILVPFASKFEPALVAMGTIAFYLMITLVVTSYGRRFISQELWRAVHFFNIALYVLSLVHAIKLGTDMKNPLIFGIFIWANALLVFMALWNAELRIVDVWKRRASLNQAGQSSEGSPASKP